jgi:hypothetical protein
MVQCGLSWCRGSAPFITGYFLPSEGASDIALPIFSFPSLAACEQYRKDAAADPDVQKAVAFAKKRAASSAMSGLFSGRCFRKRLRKSVGVKPLDDLFALHFAK